MAALQDLEKCVLENITTFNADVLICGTCNTRFLAPDLERDARVDVLRSMGVRSPIV